MFLAVSSLAILFAFKGGSSPYFAQISPSDNPTPSPLQSPPTAPVSSQKKEKAKDSEAEAVKEKMKKAQQKLTASGLFKGTVDGVYTDSFQQSIAAFQRLKGLPDNGEFTEPTYELLMQTSNIKQEIDMLERLVYAESRGEPYVGKVAVAAVVLNRVSSEQFPDTIKEVIFEKNAFSVIQNGKLPTSKNLESKKAVQDALFGQDPSKGSLYFYNPSISTSQWIFSRKTQVVIDNHVFAI